MKVNRFGDKPGFHPFDITLTVETEDEARALYAIFNYSPNVDILPEKISDEIRDQIGREFGELGSSQVIARGVTYSKFYRGKRED